MFMLGRGCVRDAVGSGKLDVWLRVLVGAEGDVPIVGTRPLQTLTKTEVMKTEPRGYTNAGHTAVCLRFIGFSSP